MKRSVTYPACAALVLFGVGILLRGARSQLASNTWISAGNMTAARSGACAALLPDGRVLITGGTGSLGALASAEFFLADLEEPLHRKVDVVPDGCVQPGGAMDGGQERDRGEWG